MIFFHMDIGWGHGPTTRKRGRGHCLTSVLKLCLDRSMSPPRVGPCPSYRWTVRNWKTVGISAFLSFFSYQQKFTALLICNLLRNPRFDRSIGRCSLNYWLIIKLTETFHPRYPKHMNILRKKREITKIVEKSSVNKYNSGEQRPCLRFNIPDDTKIQISFA